MPLGLFLRAHNVHTGHDYDECHHEEYGDLERFRVHLSLHYEWDGYSRAHNYKTSALMLLLKRNNRGVKKVDAKVDPNVAIWPQSPAELYTAAR